MTQMRDILHMENMTVKLEDQLHGVIRRKPFSMRTEES